MEVNEIIPSIGHNQPPLNEVIKDRYRELFRRMAELESRCATVPEVLANEDDVGAAQDLYRQIRAEIGAATGAHKEEKKPLDEALKVIKATFAIPAERLEMAGKAILARLDVWKEKKAAEERRAREAAAAKAREEQERKEREAAEAERRAREAEQLRLAEERRQREAEEARERARREQAEAEARAQRAREEEARIMAQRKEREAAEARERAERAAMEERNRAAEAAAREKARIQREEEQRKLDELRAQRAAEQKAADEARARAAEAQAQERAAREAAEAAAKEAKRNDREAKNSLDDALRVERRADRLEGAAQASEAELSRERGELGSVGSLVTRWTWRMVDRDRVPLEALRAYLNPDAIDAAVTRFMQAHRPELGKGRDDAILPGVLFYEDVTTRVA